MRYGQVFPATEINSSFYRSHLRSTYARWAESVPDDFRFSVKLPRTITHERRLVRVSKLLDTFVDEAEGLGARFGCLLVQLPPSLAFALSAVETFLVALRERHAGHVAVEPRHASWFVPECAALLAEYRCARVAADPARVPEAAVAGGWRRFEYWRLHGSPRIYYSSYPEDYLDGLAATIRRERPRGKVIWCIFDNTASGAAAANALTLRAKLAAAV